MTGDKDEKDAEIEILVARTKSIVEQLREVVLEMEKNLGLRNKS